MQKAAAGLLGMLVVTTAVVSIGALQKAPCANRSWVEDRTGVSIQCYSDVADLYRTEQLSGGRLPYLDACQPAANPCDEYPVLSMYVMRFTAWISFGGDPYSRFYLLSVALLLLAALLTTYCLERLGAKTILFAAAPVLAIYGTMNWDLIPVALSTAALVLLLEDRMVGAGSLLGLGAAAKIYPALMAGPFAMHGQRAQGRSSVIRFLIAAAAMWLALNVPFMIAASEGWSTFFRYNASRPAEYDTLWRLACKLGICAPGGVVNALSLFLPIALAALLWRIRIRHDPTTPLWAATFPLLVLFVLFNKVWSPQYALWLLPWFALAAPAIIPFIAWQAAEVLVFIVRFSYFGDLERGVAPYTAFGTAVFLRSSILVWCLVVWSRTVGGYAGRTGGETVRSQPLPTQVPG